MQCNVYALPATIIQKAKKSPFITERALFSSYLYQEIRDVISVYIIRITEVLEQNMWDVLK